MVLTKDDAVKRATSSYIKYDVLVEETEVTVEKVRDHNTYGLTTKPSESFENGRALGLKLWQNKAGKLMFGRGNKIPEVMDDLTKQELFTVCGKLVGHYPIVGWLRTACCFIKRQTGTDWWEDKIDQEVLRMIQEVIAEVKKEDPVKGEWNIRSVKNKELRLSHFAYGDAFLHPSFLHSHINPYGRLFTSGPRITFSHLESIRGGNWHVLTRRSQKG